MIWIPITIWAAFAQTVRNAAQRHLVADLGTLGATMVRFIYGVPFAALWLLVVWWATSVAIPELNAAFVGWVFLGGICQIVGTSFGGAAYRAKRSSQCRKYSGWRLDRQSRWTTAQGSSASTRSV